MSLKLILSVAAALGANTALATSVKLVTFDGAAATTFKFKEDEDEVMGSASGGNWSVDSAGGFGTLAGTVFLNEKWYQNQSLGFIKTGASGKFPDASSAAGGDLVLELRSSKPYSGFNVALATGSIATYACGGGGYNWFSRGCFKAKVVVPSGGEAGFTTVRVPLASLTDQWNPRNGEPRKTCAEDSSSCVTSKVLANIKRIEVVAEGVTGDVKLEIKSISVEVSSPAARTFIPGVTSEAMASRARFAKTSPMKLSSVAIPDHFDSEANWPECAKVIGDIRDQSNCGCCWAFGAASAASDRLCIATKGKVVVPLSANDVCFCASEDGCGGGDITSPWKFIQAGVVSGGQFNGTGPFVGYCKDWSFPHCHHHGPQRDDPYPAEGQPGCPSQKSSQCPTKCDPPTVGFPGGFDQKWGFEGEILEVSGADHIAQTIMEGGPVETAFTVYEDFENYSGGIYEHESGAQLGGHAVRIVGFGTENGVKYWKVANSWNPYWGEKGYFRIVRGTNNCGIEDMVTASSPDAKWATGASSTVVV